MTNPGDTPLTVSLDDDKLPALQCLIDHSGDTNVDNKLDPGETWLYTCAGQILADDTLNTVTATGVDPLGGDNGDGHRDRHRERRCHSSGHRGRQVDVDSDHP